jgi:hypothetical protein
VTIRLDAGASVMGVVSGDDGSPSAAAMLMVTSSDGSRFEIQTHASQDGTFAVRGILPGAISLRAVPLGRHIDERREEPGWDEARLTLEPGQQRTGLKLVVRRAGGGLCEATRPVQARKVRARHPPGARKAK